MVRLLLPLKVGTFKPFDASEGGCAVELLPDPILWSLLAGDLLH